MNKNRISPIKSVMDKYYIEFGPSYSKKNVNTLGKIQKQVNQKFLLWRDGIEDTAEMIHNWLYPVLSIVSRIPVIL